MGRTCVGTHASDDGVAAVRARTAALMRGAQLAPRDARSGGTYPNVLNHARARCTVIEAAELAELHSWSSGLRRVAQHSAPGAAARRGRVDFLFLQQQRVCSPQFSVLHVRQAAVYWAHGASGDAPRGRRAWC